MWRKFYISIFFLCLSAANITFAAPSWEGAIVRKILVKVDDVFTKDELNAVFKAANQIKINSKEHVILQELTFQTGTEITEFSVNESLRNLRSIKFIRLPEIDVIPLGNNEVEVHVYVQDTWTLIPQFSYSSGSGRTKESFGIQDSNLAGYGKRLELLSTKDEDQETLQAVWDDRRVMGTAYRFQGGIFNRDDGDRYTAVFDRPFRTLLDKNALEFSVDTYDQLGRLYEDSYESFIYRTTGVELGAKYTFATGNPEILTRRFTYGLSFNEETFSQASQQEIDDLDLDREELLNQDPSQLADNRRFVGPVFEYQYIKPDFVAKNYIDRFDRPEDYNLGRQVSARMQYATEFMGSDKNTILLGANTRKGFHISEDSFWRYQLAFNTRHDNDGFNNKLYSIELKYYNLIGKVKLRGLNLGRHTFIASFYTDYGKDLDRDKQLLVGGDNALRGYRARTFVGDKRIVLNMEDRIHIAEDIFKIISVGAAVFADIGSASYNDFGSMIQDEIYSDVGFGLRFAFPRSSGSRVLRLDVATPLRDGPDGSSAGGTRFLFSGGQLFDSFFPGERPGTSDTSVDFGF